MGIFRKKRYEKGYRNYEGRATRYVENPKEISRLLTKALHKAKNNKSSLSEIWDKLQLLFECVKSWSTGDYRNISKKTMIMVISAIIYFISPFDLIPDFLAGLGIVDDVAVIGYIIRQISSELDQFKAWKEKSSNIIE
jgi:uncharacterized membrane protein YkvA (DUF1232 family)